VSFATKLFINSSAAFNLNTPIVDDIEQRYIKTPLEIGKRAIEIAALGGFDKVTWDGASDSYPSVRKSDSILTFNTIER
jgi:hypothetical protein